MMSHVIFGARDARFLMCCLSFNRFMPHFKVIEFDLFWPVLRVHSFPRNQVDPSERSGDNDF
jgi:hypothetical protein